MRLLAVLGIATLLSGTYAAGQTFVPSSAYLKQPLTRDGKPAPSPFSAYARYGFGSDYADERRPRSYDHVLAADFEYKLNRLWAVAVAVNARFETVHGQIPKDEQQSYEETLHPSTGVDFTYRNTFGRHSYALGFGGEPLWDEDARREGHRGLVGAGADAGFNFFNRRFSMIHSLAGLHLINSYHYGSNLTANPDYFWIYKWRNEVRFWRTWKASYTFGAKVTRYLDGFVGYSYNNAVALGKTWGSLTASLTYENGGFTDDGFIRLWYIDEYRRVARFMVSYAF